MEILGMFWRRRVVGADSVLVDSGNDDLFHGDSIRVSADIQTEDSNIFNVAQVLIQPILMSLCTEAPQRMIAR